MLAPGIDHGRTVFLARNVAVRLALLIFIIKARQAPTRRILRRISAESTDALALFRTLFRRGKLATRPAASLPLQRIVRAFGAEPSLLDTPHAPGKGVGAWGNRNGETASFFAVVAWGADYSLVLRKAVWFGLVGPSEADEAGCAGRTPIHTPVRVVARFALDAFVQPAIHRVVFHVGSGYA